MSIYLLKERAKEIGMRIGYLFLVIAGVYIVGGLYIDIKYFLSFHSKPHARLSILFASSPGLIGSITRKVHGKYSCNDFKDQKEASYFYENVSMGTTTSGNSVEGYEYDTYDISTYDYLDRNDNQEVCEYLTKSKIQ